MMENSKIENLQKFDILTGLAILILARICCPALSNIPIFSMAFTFVYGAAFILVYFVTTKKINKKDFSLLVTAAMYTVYVLFRDFSSGNGLFARDSFNAYIIVFLTMIYIWAKEQPQSKRILLLKLIFIAFIFNYVYSIIVLYYDPNASRIAAALGALERSPYDILEAVGSFDAVYGGISVVIILLCMRRIFKEKEISNKITFLVLALALVFIVMAAYATALVLLVFALALFLSSKNKALSLILIIFLIGIVVFHESFGQWIIDLSERITYSETVSAKMNEFGHIFKTFEMTGTYGGDDGRWARMTWSWETFKQYPLFGGMGVYGARIGAHSELLDMLGRFGLFGLMFFAIYFSSLYKNIKECLQNEEMKKCLNIVVLIFVIASILNPSLYSLQMVPIIIMISLSSTYIEMCESKRAGEMK